MGLRSALDMLEVRLVYEEVGEKLCLLAAPFIVYRLDRDKEETATGGELAFATFCVFMIEEAVDSLLLIVMAKHGVNALRVKPTFWEGEEERVALAGNTTAVPM